MFKRFMPVLLCLCSLGVFSAPAFAETEGVGWDVQAHTIPTNLAPGGKGAIEVRVVNVGASNSNGTVTVTDTLPPGVIGREAGSIVGGPSSVINGKFETSEPMWDCGGNGPGGLVAGASVVTCTNDSVNASHIVGGGGLPTRGAEFEGENGALGLAAGDPELAITVEVPAGTREGTRDGSEANRVTVAGGGAAGTASVSEPVVIDSTPPPFGFAGADAWFSNADGTLDTQAGSHPYEASFSFDFNNVENKNHKFGSLAGHEPRNLRFRLPPGFIGNPGAVPQCPLSLFVTETQCPANTQVGIVAVGILGDSILSGERPKAVFNLVPPPGEPAEFGFVLDGNLTYLGTEVRSGSDYGLTSTTNNITRTEVVNAVLTLWANHPLPATDTGVVPRGRAATNAECPLSQRTSRS